MKPDVIACEAVIRVCESVESWQGALEVLSEISESWLAPEYINMQCRCTALNACEKCSQWERSLLLVLDMTKRADDLLDMPYPIVRIVEILMTPDS